ncbi:hypothetical protein KIPB_006357 [Kipferlia bialata]|uniref:Uncharacterized protein n=1 Tax=Kipferlia bialata TaxID=797122 RepID=A0A9K3CX59_9EUKA|nr:hypothetical protein KIPB_006357 [Kipferlia bialata]|eukprot:g6357.t1
MPHQKPQDPRSVSGQMQLVREGTCLECVARETIPVDAVMSGMVAVLNGQVEESGRLTEVVVEGMPTDMPPAVRLRCVLDDSVVVFLTGADSLAALKVHPVVSWSAYCVLSVDRPFHAAMHARMQ